MEDPGKMLEQGVGRDAEVMALKVSVKEGQRLLGEAIRQRNAERGRNFLLLARNTAMWNMLRRIHRHWIWWFLPVDLKQQIKSEVSRAD